MLVTPPCGASSNIALWRAKIKPPVELVVGDFRAVLGCIFGAVFLGTVIIVAVTVFA